MPVRVLVQTRDRALGLTIASLLSQYRYEVWPADSVDDTAQLARRHGPIDLVLALDPGADARAIEERLAELGPGARVLHLPSVQTGGSRGEDSRLATPAVELDAADLMEMLDHALATGDRGPRSPSVTVEALKDCLIETVLGFSLLLEQYEHLNGGNSRLVMDHAVGVARELGLSATHAEEVAFAALLQDIGMVKLRAAGRSRARDRDRDHQITRDHTLHSANFVQRLKLPWRIRHIVLAHHEWYNGLGYPSGLEGRSIPLGARILAVVNAFFSMISRRPSRAPLSSSEAMQELRRRAGSQFDPEVVEVFLTLLRQKSFHDNLPRRRRVALVSSDPAIGTLARARFDGAGVDALVIETGSGAIEALRRFTPDALVVDAELGDVSGFDVLHWTRRDDLLASLPVLLVSAADPDGSRAFMAHDMGAEDFLTKPLRPADLVSRVLAVLRRRERVARAGASLVHEGEGLRGNLAELAVAELVGILHEGRKSATVQLLLGKERGLLNFDAGQVVHARIGERTGEEAFAWLYHRREGSFIIEHGAATAERTIRRRMELLLLDVSQAADGGEPHDAAPGPAGATVDMARRPRRDQPTAVEPAPIPPTVDDGEDLIPTLELEYSGPGSTHHGPGSAD